MKTIYLLLISLILIIGCDTETENAPVETADNTRLNKATPAMKYPYLQEFEVISSEYTVEGTDINIRINIPGILNHSHDYFILVEYTNGTKEMYLGQPPDYYFTVPYYGSEDVQDITLYAIIIHLGNESEG